MKIAMLARNPNLYSHRRLVEAAEERGHEIDIIDTAQCYVNITAHRPTVRYKGESLAGYDAVIPRIGASITFYGLAIVRQFEMMGVWPLNESVAIGRSRDKLRSLQILSRVGLGLPVTGFANSAKQAEEIIRMVKGPPVVIKLLEGTQGIGVVLGETMSSAKSVVEAFRGANVNILVQEFIKEAGGTDIRAFVIGKRVVGAMMRRGAPDEFRSNLHRGGTAEKIRITPEERSTAARAAAALGLNVAGVDFLRSNHGPVIMEVNSSPGLEGIEKATAQDIAAQVIAFMEKNARPGKTRTRGKG
ncbi:MAG: 30S ribosomal protein S6--L-glutamate ligase [Gammaproteobacteria bacterium]|nr:30S ribosomal protein S6--L-glutamate ligase [Gammaproteobacteria bacterium]MDE0412724.1 30S ribosomal protein S6--L-glutamate ligase [Gammaproteobacteria bacterium]